MRKIMTVFALFVASATNAVAQSNLPECPASQTENYTNCHFVYVSESKRQYVIEFKDYARPGFGAGQSADGIKIDGIWKNRKQNGLGSTTYPDGDRFVGEYRDGKANGKGIFTWSDGDKFVGMFRNDARNGPGTLTSLNGDTIVGQWQDDKQHGPGTESFVDGRRFVGEWKDDKRHGQGTVIFANGDKFIGEFRDGKEHGQGTYTYANGDKFIGEHRDGKRNGQGNFTLANGNKFVGEFREGNFNGQGTLTLANGDTLVGIWKTDSITGTKTWKDGRKHTGEFDLNENPKAPFAYDASGTTSIIGSQLSCGTKTVKETYFGLLNQNLTPLLGLQSGGFNAPPRFAFWSQLFADLQMQMLNMAVEARDGKTPSAQVKAEMENPFPMLSLVNTRTDRRNDAIKRIECSADLVGNFGPLGTHRTPVQYVVQLTDDGNIYVSIPQR